MSPSAEISAAGDRLGGALVTMVGWRAVFWVNVPIGIGAAVFARTILPRDQHGHPAGPLDIVGPILVTLATATLAYVPVIGSAHDWSPAPVAGALVLALALLGGFVAWERRHVNPLVRLEIFRLPTLGAANAVILLFGAWNAGQVLVLALYLQRVLGYSPLEAGLVSVPQGLAGLTAGLLGARFTDRFGIRTVLLATTALAVTGQLLLALTIAGGASPALTAALLVVGLGNGGTSLAATVAGSAGVADREQGLAGGLINSSRQIGSALGVATLVAVATSVAARQPTPAAAVALATGYREAFLTAAVLAAFAFGVSAAFVRSGRPGIACPRD